MKNNTITKITKFLGVNENKFAKLTQLKAISQGLVFSSSKVEAWFKLATSNTDLKNEFELEQELELVMRQVSHVLEGKKCHLKIVWAYPGGGQFRNEAHEIYSLGNWEEWVEARAVRMDELALPVRYVFLGIVLEEKNSQTPQASAWEVLGVNEKKLPKKTLARFTGMASKQ